MAIIATYKDGNGTFKKAVLKLGKIWGSKSENWNAWVSVSKHGEREPVTSFMIVAPYVEGENPYSALYKTLGEMSFITDVEHDIEKSVGKKLTKK